MSDIPLGALFGALFLLILLSAFFSGSETALMTINRYRLRHLKSEGHKGAIRAHRLLQRPDRLIGLILLGNNLVNILASSIATVIALRLGGEGLIPIAAFLLTLVILLFAEVAPKTLAALHPERLAFPASWIYSPLLHPLMPTRWLVWLINFISNALLKTVGVTPEDSEDHLLSREELRTVVAEAGAMIPKKHQKMLLSIFDLGDATVEEIMIPRNEVDGIDLEEPLEEIMTEFQNSYYSRLPLYSGSIDNILGIIHIRSAMRAMTQDNFTKESLRDMAKVPYFIPEGTPLSKQLLNFQREKQRFGLVVDEYGDLLGLVTLADVLEEIVGEFTTDPADSIPDVQPQEDGSYLVAGSANIRELVRVYHWELPTDGPRTINGLLLEQLEDIPQPGTSLLIEGYPVEVLQIQDNAVKTVRIQVRDRISRPEVSPGSGQL